MAKIMTYQKQTLNKMYQKLTEHEFFAVHLATIEQTLRTLGVDGYSRSLPETHILPFIIEPSETIEGIVYGRYKQEQPGGEAIIGRGALLATDYRVLLIDKKPFFVRCDEISYGAISGITYTKVVFGGTVTLRTRAGNISARTFNKTCAHNYIQAVEAHIFNSAQESHHDNATPLRPIQTR